MLFRNEILYIDNAIGLGYNKYNGQKYVYRKNLQGDIVAILDECGCTRGTYEYDAWGNIIWQGGSELLTINPFRYRGYYYDEETGLYYLNSRYYDPETGRFISPDSLKYLVPETCNGLNLYAYCGNNPVMCTQELISSGTSIIASSLYKANVGNPISFIGLYSNGSSNFNSVLTSGLFVNGLLFGHGSITGLYASGHARAQISLKNGKFVIGAFGKFSFLNATGQIGIGNDYFNVSLVGIADIGTISGMAGILVDPKKGTYFAGIEAKAAVFTARGGAQFEIFGTQIEIGGSVSVLSAGFQFGIGFKDGEFYYKSGFALLFGYDYYIRIKFA